MKENKKEKPQKYVLTVDEDHLSVMEAALNLYFRIGMGQFDEIMMMPDFFGKNSDEVRVLFRQLHYKLKGMDPNSFHSIRSHAIDDRYRTACDIHDVIRHRLSWDRNPEGGSGVNFRSPEMVNGKVPLIEMVKKDIGEIEKLLKIKKGRT